MKIAELFRRDIHRTIEEVVKVDLADDAVIATELDEYVATDHILEEFEKVLDAYQETIHAPNESCTIWVSGFFGSGKSSWAKTLGYLLWNPTIDGRPAIDRFFERTDAPRLRALLNTIHAQAPTLTVLLNLATGSNVVAREGESVVLPVYRALLDRLGYSRNFLLAELEFVLEGDGRLQAFEDRFVEATGKKWNDRRFTSLAKNEASRALHLLDPDIDAVVGTLVLCSVADPDAVLTEIVRVLKPGGRYVFIEHVAAPHGTRTRRIQEIVAPVMRRLPGGCSPNRETGSAIERAGFRTVVHETFENPVAFGIAVPHIAGTATK